jgi:hypothetical protein
VIETCSFWLLFTVIIGCFVVASPVFGLLAIAGGIAILSAGRKANAR